MVGIQNGRCQEVFASDLPCLIVTRFELSDTRAIDIEANYRGTGLAKCSGYWKPNIAKANNADSASMRHHSTR